MSEARSPYYPVSLRPGAELDEQLATRGDVPGRVMKRDLVRYYALVGEELRRLALTPDDILTIADAFRAAGTDTEHLSSIPLVFAAVVEEAFDGIVKEDHGPGFAPLRVKLRALTPGQVLAVIDAIERLFRSNMRNEKAALATMGFVGADKHRKRQRKAPRVRLAPRGTSPK
jgi:hypothetical protein